MTDNVEYWLEGAPFLNTGGRGNFEDWLEGAPFLESGEEAEVEFPPRRRVAISFFNITIG